MACKQNINIKTAMLSSKEKNAKIKYTLKTSNKIIVQIKITQTTFYIEGFSGKLATLSSDIPWNISQVTCIFYVYTKKTEFSDKH